MIPRFFGYSLYFWIGIILFVLIVLQILGGSRRIKISFKWHKRTGYIILILALIHALMATGIYSRIVNSF